MERGASRRTRAPEELRCLSTIPEHDDGPTEQQCDHFTIRRYVALLQQQDPKLSSLSQIYCDHDEEQCKNPCPISGAQFRRWNCSNCLKKVQNADRQSQWNNLGQYQNNDRTRALEELICLSTTPEHDDGLIERQCDHFSIRRCVALLQQKDPKLCSFSQIYGDHDEEQCKNPCPMSGAQFRRWNCSNCLKKVQNAGHATILPTVSINQDGCSISVVQTIMTKSVAGTLLSCADRQSQGNNGGQSQGNNDARSTPSKCSQEINSKCISPSSSSKGVTEANGYSAMKDLQVSPNNHDVYNCCNVSSVCKPIPEHSNIHSGGDQVYSTVQHKAYSKKNDISYLKVYQRRSRKKRL